MDCIDRGGGATRGERLLETLADAYGVTANQVDDGITVLVRGADGALSPIVRGAGDGCATYPEALEVAVDLATEEAWGQAGSRLLRQLSQDNGIRVSWIISAQQGAATAVDEKLWQEIGAQIEAIRASVAREMDSSDTTASRRELGRRIFREMLPHDAFDRFEVSPLEGVWKLYAYARRAGLAASFVLVKRDMNGGGFGHVALALALGPSAKALIADPAYGAYDVAHQEVIGLTPLQALSYDHVQRAVFLKKKRDAAAGQIVSEINALLDRAQGLDPSNIQATAMRLLANSGAEDPLGLVRAAQKTWITLSRNRMKAKR